MTCETEEGKFRKITSGDGRKDFDTDVIEELEETMEMVDDE